MLKMGQASPQPVVQRSTPTVKNKLMAENHANGNNGTDESSSNRRGQRKVNIFGHRGLDAVFTNHNLFIVRPVTIHGTL